MHNRSKPRLLGTKGGPNQQGRDVARSVQRCVTLYHYGQKDKDRTTSGKDTNKGPAPDKSQTSLKKLSAKDKLHCFREIFKQSLKQCEALRTTMIKDSSPDRVRSVSVVDSYRGVGSSPIDEDDPVTADNLISRRVRAITSLNHEEFARSSLAGPLSFSETEAIRRKVETLITDYIGQNERWNSSVVGTSPRIKG